MSIGLRLDLRQSQGLVMTPQLQQAIKLLQLPNLELRDFVEQQIEENPFLERGEEVGAEQPADYELDGERAPTAELDGSPDFGEDGPAAGEAGDDDGWRAPATAPAADHQFAATRGGDFEGDVPDLEATSSRAVTLREHLIGQLQVTLSDARARGIGLFLVDLLDEAGYLHEDLDAVAERLRVPLAEVEAVLAALQACEPVGVGARSVSECLALQLRDRDRLDPAMRALLDHLDLLARGDIAGLLRITAVDGDDLADMIVEIRALNPKPGLAFGRDVIETMVPDVLVSLLPSGGFRVELNAHTLPKVLVDTAYYAEVVAGTRDPATRAFVGERLQTANWLVKALDQRARTVLKVAEAVVARQAGFLHRGVQHLRPLGLRDIAAATGLHESTVSRAVADKWVACPRGNLPLKYFFTNAVGDGEGAHAAEAIRQQIRTTIDQEHKDAVLSDDQIVELLRARGIVIARRTVAKYRESLGIASSVQRRRQKASGLV